MRGHQSKSFVALMTILNIGVACMLYLITLSPPVAAIEPFSYNPPKLKRIDAPVVHSSIPKRLVVSSLSIDMKVKRASFNPTSRQWTDNGLDASYATASVPPNDSNGTTVVFAHAQWGAFAALPTIQKGATAKVYGNDGSVYVYKSTKQVQVTPDDTSIFTAGGPPRLVLQTCSGAWDAYRTLVYFDFVKVKT